MCKYRIIKKVNYNRYGKIYPEVYFIQVKYFLFYYDLTWWCGSDVGDCSPNRRFNNMANFPTPYYTTKKKFPNMIESINLNNLMFLSKEAALFFIEEINNQNEFCKNIKKLSKEKTTEITYVNNNSKKLNIISL